MSLYEVDELLTRSITFFKKSALKAEKKRPLIWNLERLPKRYDMDAGNFPLSEIGDDVAPIFAAVLGKIVIEEAHQQKDQYLVYHWTAFLLNYFDYFKEDMPLAQLKEEHLSVVKDIYHQYDFEDYEPAHRSLEVYEVLEEEMEAWFSPLQLEILDWFLN
ncbi:MAG: hypothetical protein ACRBFS_02805 [Aureispira sp.]